MDSTDEEKWEEEWQRKEEEVIELYSKGLSYSQIAEKTGGATQTIIDIIKKANKWNTK